MCDLVYKIYDDYVIVLSEDRKVDWLFLLVVYSSLNTE